MKRRLFAPGPVELPTEVLAALSRPVMHHRTAEFQALFADVRSKLARVFMTPGDDVAILAGSGTAGMEAAFLATVPAGARVVAINAGKFGERWVRLARAFGADVVELEFEWGKAASPARLAEALRQYPDTAAVLATHSETSTGVLHDVQALAAVTRESAPSALFLVDAVTSLSSAALRPVEWGIDAVISGSQKGLLCTPGLAYVWLSPRAREERPGLLPSFYLDLRSELARQAAGNSLTTPAVSLVAAQQVALDLLLGEGIENVWARRARLTGLLVEGAVRLGFHEFAERRTPAVAALRVPAGISAREVVRHLAGQGITIAGGQDAHADLLIRPSLLGHADELDVDVLLAALGRALSAQRQAAGT
mgnify:CR=1 FL=1